VLDARDVDVFYGRIQALHGVSLHVPAGEIVSIVGANGAGKTTFLRALCGLTQVRSGSIALDGKELTGLDSSEIVRLGVVQVPAGGQVFKNLSVRENLMLGAFTRTGKRANRAGVEHDLARMVELLPILGKRAGQAAGTLSGGEQQMVAIARALMARPRVLLLDEPSLGLAPLVLDTIFAALQRLNRETQLTIVLVEQNAHLALDYSSLVYIFETGRVVEQGSAESLRQGGRIAEIYLGLEDAAS
jgi:branched-chain amino acid transport system ATP-binding protein